MAQLVAPRSIAVRASWLLLAPLCVSIVPGVTMVAASYLTGAPPDPAWTLLIVLGPSIPLYLLLLPLLPFVLRALRRGWHPRPAAIVLASFVVSGLFDLAFWLGRG